MFARSLVLPSVLSLSLLAMLGCASSVDPEEDEISASEDELAAARTELVGRYYRQPAGVRGFARLTLDADGTYAAQIDVSAVALCASYPCLAPESGRWSAFRKPGGGFRLRVRAAGEPARWYDASKKDGTLVLTRDGASETLVSLDADECLDDADCAAGEACGPKMCLMWCAVDDPFCCGPSTCEPATPPPPPPPSCWGAWLDENGLCRTPADGVYPEACCGGPACGNAQCASGEVCCNPLQGICTQPDEVCIQ
jgi:hypothetical protein